MRLVEALGDPHDDLSLQARQICQHLPKMLKIGMLQLVFDEHSGAIL